MSKGERKKGGLTVGPADELVRPEVLGPEPLLERLEELPDGARVEPRVAGRLEQHLLPGLGRAPFHQFAAVKLLRIITQLSMRVHPHPTYNA